MKPAIFILLLLACLTSLVPSLMAEPIIGPNTLVFTELSSTQLNVAWSTGTPSDLTTSPIFVEALSADRWRVGLTTFLLRTPNTICPDTVNCVVPLGWVEPEDNSKFNIVTFGSDPCTVLGRPIETCIDVLSDFSFSDFRFAPLQDGETFSNTARRASTDTTPLNFAFVDPAETAVPEPSSIGLIAIGLVGIGFQLRGRNSRSRG